MIVLLGSTGYVGKAFSRHLEASKIACITCSRVEFDYSTKSGLTRLLLSHKPDFVVNCAGYTGKPNVDACELDKGNCLDGNSVLPGVIRDVCEELGIRWGHVSSGCIFSGERPGGGGWKEEDAPNFSFRRPPCSFYSGTKALGEEILGWNEGDPSGDCLKWVHESEPSGYVWRLRIPFNEEDSSRNYLSKLQRYDRLLDARNSLSQLDDFVKACIDCWMQGVPLGIYNVTNPGSVTTREVIELIKKAGVLEKEFSFFETEEEFMSKATIAPRSNCVLDDSKLARAGVVMRPVKEALEYSLANWKKESFI